MPESIMNDVPVGELKRGERLARCETEAVSAVLGRGRASWPSRLFNPDFAPTAFIALVTIGLVAYFTGPLCSDVSGQFLVAHAMRGGARLYIDLVEINPPLWFWMAMPVDWLAEVLRVRTEPVTIIAVALWVFLAVHACRRLLAGEDPKRLTRFLLYTIGILLIVPMQITEQREHLALIGAVPYLVLAAQRRRGHRVPSTIAILIGIEAALGLALKPHFLAVPLLTEIWLFPALRRDWRPLRPETIAFAGVGATYLVAVILFTPQFLTDVVPRLFPVYEAAKPSVFGAIDGSPLLWVFMLLGMAPYRRAILEGKAPLTTAFLLGFAGFAFAYLAQHQAWIYQELPAAACIALALASLVMEQGWPTSRARLFLPALLLWPLAFVLARPSVPDYPQTDIARAIDDLKPGDAFGLVSSTGLTAWPSILNRGLINASRYNEYWILFSYDGHWREPWIRQAMARAVRETALDYRCLPPKVIVFTNPERLSPRAKRHHMVANNPYRLFMSVPEFAFVMSHYRLADRYGFFDVYRPMKPMPPIDRHLCRNSGS
jgi:hypothetical protein